MIRYGDASIKKVLLVNKNMMKQKNKKFETMYVGTDIGYKSEGSKLVDGCQSYDKH